MNVGGWRKGVVPAGALGFFLCFALSFGSGPGFAESEPQLHHRGRTMAEWQADLSHATPQVRLRATSALESFGAAAVPALVQALGDPHWQICDSAMHALIRIGPPAAAPLIQALAGPDSKIRGRSAYVLGRIRPAEPASVQALAQALSDANVLRDPDIDRRREAAAALGRLGPAAKAAVSELQRLVTSDPDLRYQAEVALRSIERR
jgi:HEAT repeat protein